MSIVKEWCRHRTSLLEKVCHAGVTYDSVMGEKGAYPCFFRDDKVSGNALKTCSLASYPTKEEVEQSEKESAQFVTDYFAAITRNECPICHKTITLEQVGRCVYASCGHRLYQGRLPN